MMYRLWLGDLECGVAADEHAMHWLEKILERYPDQDVWIEAAPGAQQMFPLWDDEEERGLEALREAGSVAVGRCPECQAVISFPGFDAIFAFVCPECGRGVNTEPRVA
jgi:hypothetical protein